MTNIFLMSVLAYASYYATQTDQQRGNIQTCRATGQIIQKYISKYRLKWVGYNIPIAKYTQSFITSV